LLEPIASTTLPNGKALLLCPSGWTENGRDEVLLNVLKLAPPINRNQAEVRLGFFDLNFTINPATLMSAHKITQ